MSLQEADIYELIQGFHTTQAIYAAVRLHLPEALADGSHKLEVLASTTSCDPALLKRLLHFLVAMDIATEPEADTFVLASKGEALLPNSPQSLASFAIRSGEELYQGWSKLHEGLVANKAPFERKKKEDDFKRMLSTFGGDNVVKIIFIDELDRCSPKFAIKLLERIKYLFNSKNVCFILMADKQALSSIVKGYYGEEIDSEKYIEKFFEFTIDYVSEYVFINGVLQANMKTAGGGFAFDYKTYIDLIKPTPRQMARSGRLIDMCSPFVNTAEEAIIGFSRNCDTSFFEYLCEIIDKRVYDDATLIREYAQKFIYKSKASSYLDWIKHTDSHTERFNAVRAAFFNIFFEISFFCIYEYDKSELFAQEIKSIKPSYIEDVPFDLYLSQLQNILLSGKAPDIIKAIRLFRNMSPCS